MPRYIESFTIGSLSAHVPDRMSGNVWTNQLLNHIQQTLIAPQITERLKVKRETYVKVLRFVTSHIMMTNMTKGK